MDAAGLFINVTKSGVWGENELKYGFSPKLPSQLETVKINGRKKMISEITKQGRVDVTIFEGKTEKGEGMKQEADANRRESVNREEKSADTKSPEAYSAVNRDGDTLEISGERINKKVIKEGGENIKLPDVSLKNYTREKLKMLLQSGRITRQQYDKAVRKARA